MHYKKKLYHVYDIKPVLLMCTTVQLNTNSMDLSSTSIAIKPQDYWLLWLKHCSTCGDPFFFGGGGGELTSWETILFFFAFYLV